MSDDFPAYRSDPTSEALIRLLRAHQDRVYRLCFHVLRRAHDAEDAAQEALIRIAAGARAIGDAAAFHRWVYRVSLNSALEFARKAARRRAHETRAVMTDTPRDPLDDETRRALFEAIGGLDDRPRAVLLDHYFEDLTLEEVASREGVSPQAVSKRLEKARARLKRALPASLGAALNLGRLFERDIVTTVTPDLVSGAVLAKVNSVAALAAAGGLAMTSKSSIAAAISIVAAICLTGGAGLGYAIKGRSDSNLVRTLEARLATAEKEATGLRVSLRSVSDPSPKSEAIGKGPEPAGEPTSSLRRRLERYKAWKSRWDKDWAANQERFRTDDAFFQEMANRKDRERKEQFKGMRELACQEPQAFLQFLRENQDYVILNEVADYGLIFEFAGSIGIMAQQFRVFPKELTEGLFEILESGTTVQKVVMLELFGKIHNPPQEFKDAYLSRLDDPSLQQAAIRCVSKTVPTTQELVQKLCTIGHATPDRHTRWAVVEALTYARYPEAEVYLLECLESSRDGIDVEHFAGNLSRWYLEAATYAIPISEDRYHGAALAALGRHPSVNGQTALVRGALYLSPARTKAVIEHVMAASGDSGLRDKLSRILVKINQGQTRRDELLKILAFN